jgi:hypothetical protein
MANSKMYVEEFLEKCATFLTCADVAGNFRQMRDTPAW